MTLRVASDTSEKATTLWVDNLRIVAAFAVVVIHVSSGVMDEQATGSTNWWIGNLYNSMMRWCVPAFVMVSGLLLLDPSKNESIRLFYRKRTRRVLVPLLFWTMFFLG